MATDIARVIALRTGQHLDYVQSVINNIQEAGACSGVLEAISHVLLAVSACAPPESATSVARHYSALTDEEGNTAGDMIEGILRAFYLQKRTKLSQLAFRSWINLYRTRPALCLVTPLSGGGHYERIFSETHDPNAWCAGGGQEYTSIAGPWLFNVASDMRFAAAVAA